MPSSWDEKLGQALRAFSSGCLVLLGLVLCGVVFIRFFPVAKLSWSDEIVEWAFAWMVFLGAAALWKDNAHFRLEFLNSAATGKPWKRWLDLVVELANLFFLFVFTYYGYILTSRANDRSPILEWPRPIWYACIPLAGLIMVIFSVRRIILVFKPRTGGDAAAGQPPERS